MGRIFKSEDVVRTFESVKIPDWAVVELSEDSIPPEEVYETDEEEDPYLFFDEEEHESINDDLPGIMTDFSQDYSLNEDQDMISITYLEEHDRILAQRDSIIRQAELKAERILENARAESERILSEAKDQAVELNEESSKRESDEGSSVNENELENCLSELRSGFYELRKNQEDFFDECADQMKFLAIEIAEKIMAQKLETDPELIVPLVKSAVKSIRDVKWIKVEISDKLNKAAGSLEQLLSELKPDTNTEIEFRRGAPAGTCVVHTAEGVTVASVLTQIENIHKYFSEYRDNDNDERESGSDKTQKESES